MNKPISQEELDALLSKEDPSLPAPHVVDKKVEDIKGVLTDLVLCIDDTNRLLVELNKVYLSLMATLYDQQKIVALTNQLENLEGK